MAFGKRVKQPHDWKQRYTFVKIDESTKYETLLGDDTPVEVKGKRKITIETKKGEVKHINDVLYVPSLACNFLSGENLLKRDFFFFKKNEWIIYDKENHD